VSSRGVVHRSCVLLECRKFWFYAEGHDKRHSEVKTWLFVITARTCAFFMERWANVETAMASKIFEGWWGSGQVAKLEYESIRANPGDEFQAKTITDALTSVRRHAAVIGYGCVLYVCHKPQRLTIQPVQSGRACQGCAKTRKGEGPTFVEHCQQVSGKCRHCFTKRKARGSHHCASCRRTMPAPRMPQDYASASGGGPGSGVGGDNFLGRGDDEQADFNNFGASNRNFGDPPRPKAPPPPPPAKVLPKQAPEQRRGTKRALGVEYSSEFADLETQLRFLTASTEKACQDTQAKLRCSTYR
jgi:hypothetical protein